MRQRAVDLLYAMCDHSNAVTIVTELLEYLKSKADYSIREELVGGGAGVGWGKSRCEFRVVCVCTYVCILEVLWSTCAVWTEVTVFQGVL